MELDTDILRQQKTTTTSMADLYGYSVFSEEFQKNVMSYQKRIEEEREGYLNNVLTKASVDEINAAFQKVFAAETSLVKKANYERAGTSHRYFLSMTMFMLLGIVLAGGVWLAIEKKRKEKKLYEDNHLND